MSDRALNDRLRDLVAELVEQGLTLEHARQEFEKQFIAISLERHEGNLGRTARFLGVHRNTLRNKLVKLSLNPSDLESRGFGRRGA